MLMFYHNLPEADIPIIEHGLEYTSQSAVKDLLKVIYKESEGNDFIALSIYDAYVDKENDVTLVDLIGKYMNFPFVKLIILEPLKVYENLSNTMELHGVLEFSHNMQKRADILSDTMHVHIIDDIRYFFIGANIF